MEEEDCWAESVHALSEFLHLRISCAPIEEAVSALHRSVATGNPRALWELGRLHHEGSMGVLRDEKRAMELFLLSARLGCAAAMVRCAYAFAKGRGVEKNEQEGEKWARAAWESQDAFARGYCCEWGLGVPLNVNQASKYYRDAAKKDESTCAQYRLSVLVCTTPDESMAWCERAARQGTCCALLDLACMKEKAGDLVACIDNLKKGAHQLYAPAMARLARFHYNDKLRCFAPARAAELICGAILRTDADKERKTVIAILVQRLRLQNRSAEENYALGRAFHQAVSVFGAILSTKSRDQCVSLYLYTNSRARTVVIALLGCKKFRPVSALSCLPKDITQLLGKMLWAWRVTPGNWDDADKT